MSSSVSPVSATPDVAQHLALRKALDGMRTPADGVIPALQPHLPASETKGTPKAEAIASSLDLSL
jgi:hypothetical protein